MNKYIVAENARINRFLQKQYKREQQVRKTNPRLADQMQRCTSVVADYMLTATGVRRALREFWAEQRSLV